MARAAVNMFLDRMAARDDRQNAMRVRYRETDVFFGNRRQGLPVAIASFQGGAVATKADIKRVSDEMARRYPGYKFQVTTNSTHHGWRSGQWYNGGEGVEPTFWQPSDHYVLANGDVAENYPYLADDTDAGTVTAFTIVGQPIAGGAGEHNDCLFKELLAAHGGDEKKLAKGAPNTPEALKQALKLKRDDLIPADAQTLRTIEGMYRTRIILTGSCSYVSNAPYQRRVDLVLTAGGHFESPRQQAVAQRCLKPRNPVVWTKNSDGSMALYSAKGLLPSIPPHTLFRVLRSEADCFRRIERTTGKHGKSLEANWKEWAVEREALLKASGGTVDMYVTPKYTEAALREVEALSTTKFAPLPPEQQEWVSAAFRGGLIWAQKGWEGKAIQYDVNSQYPSLLAAKSQTWPVGEGTYQTLKGKPTAATSGKKYWPYGIYRTKPLERCPGPMQYRAASEQYYTHYDLETYEAATGKEAELADDQQHNALIWEPKARAAGSTIFGAFVKKWYALKQEKVPGAKLVLTCIWGALSRRDAQKRIYSAGSCVPEDRVLLSLHPEKGGAWMVETRGANIFSGAAPAIGCFLTSLARSKIAATVRPFINRVVRISTDSFCVSMEGKGSEEPVKVSTELGGLKREHAGVAKIKHVHAVTWTGCKCAKCGGK